jgi:hypothetical protein
MTLSEGKTKIVLELSGREERQAARKIRDKKSPCYFIRNSLISGKK